MIGYKNNSAQFADDYSTFYLSIVIFFLDFLLIFGTSYDFLRVYSIWKLF